MNLENQVCSLENAKRLKELGLFIPSLFYWDYYGRTTDPVIKPVEKLLYDTRYEQIPAYTVAELGEIIMAHVTEFDFKYDGDNIFDVNYWAKLLIGLIEKGHIKL